MPLNSNKKSLFFCLGCGDKSGYCIFVRNPGQCSNRYKYYCPRSCKVCSGPKSEICMNLKDARYNCQSRAVRGECRASNYRTRQKMKIYCPKVCCERGELYRQ